MPPPLPPRSRNKIEIPLSPKRNTDREEPTGDVNMTQKDNEKIYFEIKTQREKQRLQDQHKADHEKMVLRDKQLQHAKMCWLGEIEKRTEEEGFQYPLCPKCLEPWPNYVIGLSLRRYPREEVSRLVSSVD